MYLIKSHIKVVHSKVPQKNRSALTKEAYAVYISFHKLPLYLKDAHVEVRCDHDSLCKFMYSVMKNEKE